MFNHRKASAIEANRVSAYPSTRSAIVIRRPDTGRSISPTAAQTSAEPAERSGSGDRFAVVMGFALSLALAISGLAAIAHIWANAGMIR